MFSKQNPTNPADAREAVKKQLLRSLMQQVVDEVSSMDAKAFDSMVSSLMGDMDTTALHQRIEAQIESGFASAFDKLSIEERIAEKQAAFSNKIDEIVKERLEADLQNLSSSIDEEIVDRIEVIQQESLESINAGLSQRISKSKASLLSASTELIREEVSKAHTEVEAQVSDAVHREMQALPEAIEGLVQTTIEEKRASINVDNVVASHRDACMSEAAEQVQEKVKSMITGVVASQCDSFDMESAVAELSSATSEMVQAQINSIDVEGVVSEHRDACMTEATDRVQEKVKSMITGVVASQRE